MRIEKLIDPNWRAHQEDQSYNFGSSIRRLERQNSYREIREL